MKHLGDCCHLDASLGALAAGADLVIIDVVVAEFPVFVWTFV